MPKISELTEATAVDDDDLFLVIEDGVAKKIAAVDLPGGGGSGEAFQRDITQTSHGFVVGEVVYYTGSAYDEALADDPVTAEVVGIVSAVADVNNFTLLSGGYISGLSGLTVGEIYFLSPTTAGALTATEPTTVGHVSKPLLIADSTTSGYFFNMRGLVISGTTSGQFDAYALIRDQKASGTAGGTWTAGAWRTHVLNTEVFDAGGIVTLASNQFTLDAGTYYFDAWFMGHFVGLVKGRIFNITDSTDAAIGSSGAANEVNTPFPFTVKGRVTIAASKVFELQCWCDATNADDGFGLAANLDGKAEVYAEVEIWREIT